jgi:hypothetical protein
MTDISLNRPDAEAIEREAHQGNGKATYNPTPVPGYGDGLVKSTEAPFRYDNNDWIQIGEHYFNVHPYRSDFDGYPVRWIEIYIAGQEWRSAVRPADADRVLNGAS